MTDPVKPLQWTKASELYFTPGPSRMYSNNAVWGGFRMGSLNWGLTQENVWHTIDLKPFGVEECAIAAFLSGVLIITSGTTNEIADLHCAFRRPGDTITPTDAYIGQTVLSGFGGQRSWGSTWVPLVGGNTEFTFHATSVGDYPLHAAYGFNLSLQTWVK